MHSVNNKHLPCADCTAKIHRSEEHAGSHSYFVPSYHSLNTHLGCSLVEAPPHTDYGLGGDKGSFIGRMRPINVDEVDLNALAEDAETYTDDDPDLGALRIVHEHGDDERGYLERYPQRVTRETRISPNAMI